MGGISSKSNTHLKNELGINYPSGVNFVGFENKNNICYANSTIQCLYHCQQFNDFIKYANISKEVPNSENPIFILQDLFKQIEKKQTGYIATSKLMKFAKKKNPMYSDDSHQDCHEFIQFYLNEIDELLNKEKKQKNDVKNIKPINKLQEIFQGVLVSKTTCNTCNNVSERQEQFFDISLDIESNTSLNYCIKQISQKEKLTGSDKFHCDTCKSLQDATKQVLLKQLPKTLIIHLKRFKYDQKLQDMKKITWKVAFPFTMRLQQNYDIDDDEDFMYELYGIVIHLGQGQRYGHYQAMIKIKDRWYLYNDETILIQHEADIFGLFGNNHYNSCAYMLFYQQIEKKQQNKK